jgi:anthranilate/para-aminobenzoate synthase component I
MHHPESETVRMRSPRREVRRIPVGTRPDPAALVPALGLVPGVDSFVLLDGDGWGTRILAFDPERVLSVEGASPFEEIRRLLTAGEHPGGRIEGHAAAGPALFGYLSYDAARSLECLPTVAEDDLRLPVASFILPRYVVGVGPEGTWASVPVGESTSFILRALRRSALLPDAAPAAPASTLRAARSTLGREGYVRAVERVKEYVRAGDVFQVNISQRFEVPFEGDPLALYGALRRRNPSPFGGMVSFPGLLAVSSSPERLVDLRGRRASTRPIAGT